jgi:8-oxo-dGTP pyrophosphatase MutT (NUDIX family)
MPNIWKPSVTVAAVIERDGHFLMIEEETSDGVRLNQPAGHLDPHESLEQAVVREVLEETAHEFTPTALVGMYMSSYCSKRRGIDVTYLRFTFCGTPGKELDQPLDRGIIRTLWMTRDEIAETEPRHRSPIVLRCVDDYLAGMRAPLELMHTHLSVFEGGLT